MLIKALKKERTIHPGATLISRMIQVGIKLQKVNFISFSIVNGDNCLFSVQEFTYLHHDRHTSDHRLLCACQHRVLRGDVKRGNYPVACRGSCKYVA